MKLRYLLLVIPIYFIWWGFTPQLKEIKNEIILGDMMPYFKEISNIYYIHGDMVFIRCDEEMTFCNAYDYETPIARFMYLLK